MAERLLIIGGPTGSGKNQLALRLGEQNPVEIINADSRQIYRDLLIGTNLPSDEEMRAVPHHLFAFLDPSKSFSAADYQQLAVNIIHNIHARGSLPVVVGGTGFYIKALLRGVWPVPGKDPQLRARFRKIQQRRSLRFLYRMLDRLDPDAAKKINPSDAYRVTRALEIRFISKKSRSQWEVAQPERFDALKFYLNPPRAQLYSKLEQRTEMMFQAGWIEEVQRLMQQYHDFENMPASASLGYREIIAYLKGVLDLNSCKQRITQKTQQYAKRQLTWFRNQDGFSSLSEGNELHNIIQSLQLEWGN